jgi:uncharacterized protein
VAFDLFSLDQVILLLGQITLMVLAGLLVLGLVLAILIAFSIRTGRMVYPRLFLAGMALVEGVIRALCGLLGIEDRELTEFVIRLHNRLNQGKFDRIPAKNKAIFLPQCLRSTKCPAHLTPEGLICQRCMLCEIGRSIDHLEAQGYRVHIVPGSTFIKRIVRAEKPKAIIGVGCLMEVREGLMLADRLGLVAMGVVTLKDGCIETLVNWADIKDLAMGAAGDLEARLAVKAIE